MVLELFSTRGGKDSLQCSLLSVYWFQFQIPSYFVYLVHLSSLYHHIILSVIILKWVEGRKG